MLLLTVNSVTEKIALIFIYATVCTHAETRRFIFRAAYKCLDIILPLAFLVRSVIHSLRANVRS